MDASGFQQRCQVFAAGKQELLRNLDSVDECCAQLAYAMDGIIAQAQKCKEHFLGQMQTWKAQFSAEIYQSLAEVEATLGQDNVQLRGAYSMALRNYTPGCLTLFEFHVDSTQLEAGLVSVVRTSFRKPTNEELPSEVFWVEKDTIKSFDVKTERLHAPAKLTSPIPVDSTSRWAAIDGNRLVVCGGGGVFGADEWKSAHLLTKAGRVDVLPEMQYGHKAHGICVWNGKVHVFGSTGKAGACKCEAWSLRDDEWALSPEMHKQRYCFTPAVWQKAVYLCGGANNPTVEVFDGVSVTLLQLQFPEGKLTIACVKGDSLLVITDHYFLVLSKSVSNEISFTQTQRQVASPGACNPPLLWNDVIYSFCLKGIFKYSASTGNSLD